MRRFRFIFHERTSSTRRHAKLRRSRTTDSFEFGPRTNRTATLYDPLYSSAVITTVANDLIKTSLFTCSSWNILKYLSIQISNIIQNIRLNFLKLRQSRIFYRDIIAADRLHGSGQGIRPTAFRRLSVWRRFLAKTGRRSSRRGREQAFRFEPRNSAHGRNISRQYNCTRFRGIIS